MTKILWTALLCCFFLGTFAGELSAKQTSADKQDDSSERGKLPPKSPDESRGFNQEPCMNNDEVIRILRQLDEAGNCQTGELAGNITQRTSRPNGRVNPRKYLEQYS